MQRGALKALGLSVSNKAFHCLVIRYSNKKGDVAFDDFVLCVCRLKTVFGTSRARCLPLASSLPFPSLPFPLPYLTFHSHSHSPAQTIQYQENFDISTMEGFSMEDAPHWVGMGSYLGTGEFSRNNLVKLQFYKKKQV